MIRLLLDTHALVIWCSNPESLSAARQHALQTIGETNPALIADISLWEIAVLTRSGRLRFDLPLREWLTRGVAPPLVRVAGITPEIAIEVTLIHNSENCDPADRLIRESGLVAVI